MKGTRQHIFSLPSNYKTIDRDICDSRCRTVCIFFRVPGKSFLQSLVHTINFIAKY